MDAEPERAQNGSRGADDQPGVGLGVGLVALDGTADGVGDVLDGVLPQAAMSAATHGRQPGSDQAASTRRHPAADAVMARRS